MSEETGKFQNDLLNLSDLKLHSVVATKDYNKDHKLNVRVRSEM